MDPFSGSPLSFRGVYESVSNHTYSWGILDRPCYLGLQRSQWARGGGARREGERERDLDPYPLQHGIVESWVSGPSFYTALKHIHLFLYQTSLMFPLSFLYMHFSVASIFA